MDVITLARELGKEIQKDEAYLKLMVAQQNSDQDERLQSLIGEFNEKRVALNNEVNKEDKDQDKINAINDDVRAIYNEVVANQNMINFNSAKTELDEKMDFILQILRGSVNGENPETIEQSVGGCGGSCGSCGGCG